jgi:hypothetical protein
MQQKFCTRNPFFNPREINKNMTMVIGDDDAAPPHVKNNSIEENAIYAFIYNIYPIYK